MEIRTNVPINCIGRECRPGVCQTHNTVCGTLPSAPRYLIYFARSRNISYPCSGVMP